MDPSAPPPLPSLARRAAAYLLFVAASVGVLFAGLRLDDCDLSMPFEYDGDALLILPFIKATVERGSHWRNERLGAPGIQELHDFPVVDHLHFAVIWVLGQVVRDAPTVYNLYYLLTYPLTVLTTMAVLRHFGLSLPASGVGGLLYAFQPYHYLRGVLHYFLSGYYVIPLTMMLALWVCRGRLPFFRERPGGGYAFAPWSRDACVTLVVGLLTASAGAYYAFFGCALLAVAGLYGWVALRTWKACASAALVIGTVVVGGIANHAPTFPYQYEYGRNSAPHTRLPEEAEIYGLKVAHLFLPVTNHNSLTLAGIRSSYETEQRPLENENHTGTLGLVAALGLAVLLAVAVLPVRKTWPLGPLAVLTLFAVLLGTIGGLGAIFNHTVSPQVRAYNRISIYIAFLAVFASMWLLDRALVRAPHWLRWLVFVGVAALGVWDQTDDRWFRKSYPAARGAIAKQYRTDAEYFGEAEKLVPEGMVFCIPHVPYPEQPTFLGGASCYYNGRGYLHTKNLRWSFGAMKGREIDLWQRRVSTMPTRDMLDRLSVRGFAALFVDERAILPEGLKPLNEHLAKELGPTVPKVVHPAGNQVLYDLRPYAARRRVELGAKFDELRREEEEAVTLLWLHGFHCTEPVGLEWRRRGAERSAEVVFVNPSDRPRRLQLTFTPRTSFEADAYLRIEGTVWADQLAVNKFTPERSWQVTVPPGRHTVRFRCRPADTSLPGDGHRTAYWVADFRMTEIR